MSSKEKQSCRIMTQNTLILPCTNPHDDNL